MTPPMVDPRDAELAACPFCGGERITTGGLPTDPVYCLDCGARAIDTERWNTRPEPLAGSGVAGELERLAAKATPGPWDVYPQPIKNADDALSELSYQVEHTEPLAPALYLLNAGGKCPALTGCGPTSEANAKLIAALVTNLPTILQSLRAHPAPDQSAHCSGEVVEVVARAIEFADDEFVKDKDATGIIVARAGPEWPKALARAAIAALSAPRPDEGVES
jgi:hypothetical protein